LAVDKPQVGIRGVDLNKRCLFLKDKEEGDFELEWALIAKSLGRGGVPSYVNHWIVFKYGLGAAKMRVILGKEKEIKG